MVTVISPLWYMLCMDDGWTQTKLLPSMVKYCYGKCLSSNSWPNYNNAAGHGWKKK
jgi:hypothetical protein